MAPADLPRALGVDDSVVRQWRRRKELARTRSKRTVCAVRDGAVSIPNTGHEPRRSQDSRKAARGQRRRTLDQAIAFLVARSLRLSSDQRETDPLQ
jgi:hypothetical protein